MSWIGHFSALSLTVAAALLASAPLMLLLDRAGLESTTTVVVALLAVLTLPVGVAVLCYRLVRYGQPMSAWVSAILTGLAIAGVTALSL